jgi:hypothetical protein
VTLGRLLGCALELLQLRLMYTLWREGVLVPEHSLPRLISCSIGMLPSWQVGQTHLHPSLAAQPFTPLRQQYNAFNFQASTGGRRGSVACRTRTPLLP